MDVMTYASDALFDTIEAGLATKLAALDADRDSSLLRLSERAPYFIRRGFTEIDVDVARPIVLIDRDSLRNAPNYKTGENLVTVRIGVILPGPIGGKADLHEAVRAYAAAVVECVKDGDGRGPWMVGGEANFPRVSVCRPRGITVQPGVRPYGADRASAFPAAVAIPEFEVQVWTTESL